MNGSRVVLYGLALMGMTQTTVSANSSPRLAPPIRICADPNNLPFSDSKGAGFENRIARVIANDLKRPLRFVWWVQHRGYLRRTLKAGQCDVWIGIPAGTGPVLTTRPYYRSTYVFVSRTDRRLDIRSFDDPRLSTLRVGVPLAGDGQSATPAAYALARRGITQNVTGYSVYANYRQRSPTTKILQAVARGDIDIAVVWGPVAGYYASVSPVSLTITNVSPQIELPYLPFVFDIAMGVQRSDTTLRNALDSVIVRRQRTINTILADYHVPRIDAPNGVNQERRRDQ